MTLHDNPPEFAECPVPIVQHPAEWFAFYSWVAERHPRRILEIGSLFGGTLWYWAQLKPELIVSVDDPPPPGDERAERLGAARALWRGWFDGIVFRQIVGNSHSRTTVARVAEWAPFDLIFVDGDHTVAGAREDWENYSPMLAPGGAVVLHDTVGQEGPRLLAARLRAEHLVIEFAAPPDELMANHWRDWWGPMPAGWGLTVVLP